ncbi:MAG TPA: hypothetical protein VHT73_05465 [Thermodesulfobacteriota bacterium]|nr:hypothetical protein [Thermodesulfobacteriota bacterium]
MERSNAILYRRAVLGQPAGTPYTEYLQGTLVQNSEVRRKAVVFSPGF